MLVTCAAGQIGERAEGVEGGDAAVTPGRQIRRAAIAPAFPPPEEAHAQHRAHRHYQR